MPIFDLPNLLAQRILAIYKNGLKLIVPDTASTPAGKIAHGEGFATNFVESTINRVTDNHRLNMRRWTTNTPTYGVNTKTYDDLETCELGDIIYQNRSGGLLTFTSIPGIAPITEWFPLTNGGTPTFNIPFWNNTGVVMLAGGLPVTTGAVTYANQVIVRAENGLYQRNDLSNPPPVSTNFLDEFAAGKWIFIGEFTFLTRTEFTTRLSNSDLIPNRSYFLTDVNVFLQATNVNNYSLDGALLVTYGAAPQRGTTEIEKVKYNAVTNIFLERIDNYGNYVIQTSDSSNGGGAANCISFAPWGHNEFENNYIENVRYTAANVANGSISSYKNNYLKNTLITNPSPGTTIVFNDNVGFSGSIIMVSATVTFTDNKVFNGGTVDSLGVSLTNATADGPGCVANSDNTTSRGLNCTASGAQSTAMGSGSTAAATRSIALMNASVGSSATNGMAVGVTASVTAPNGIALGEGTGVSGDNGFATNDHCSVTKESSSSRGKYSVDTFPNQHSIGWAEAGSLTGAFGQLQIFDVVVGLETPGATGTPLTSIHAAITPQGLTVPAGHTWAFTFDITACNGLANISRWYGNGQLINTAGVITYLGNICYLDNAGVWATHVSTPAVRYTQGAAMGSVVFGSSGSNMTITVTGIAATNIHWLGSLHIVQNGQS